jgi:hypothetical protein
VKFRTQNPQLPVLWIAHTMISRNILSQLPVCLYRTFETNAALDYPNHVLMKFRLLNPQLLVIWIAQTMIARKLRSVTAAKPTTITCVSTVHLKPMLLWISQTMFYRNLDRCIHNCQFFGLTKP